jgi:hypothetical protein
MSRLTVPTLCPFNKFKKCRMGDCMLFGWDDSKENLDKDIGKCLFAVLACDMNKFVNRFPKR